MDLPLGPTLMDPLISGWEEALINATLDDVEGIRIGKITNNNISRITQNKRCSLFVGTVPPQMKTSAHVHHQGLELYYVIQGKGVILTAEVQGDQVETLFSMPIEKGESFGIPEGMGHQLKNIGSEDFIFILASPPEHLTTDRHLISDIGPRKLDPFFEC